MVAAQLSTLGVEAEPWPRLGWMRADIARLNVPEKYVVLIVGSAPERPEKRWPIAHYAQLARHMVAHGFSVVAVGSGAEATLIQHLCELEPAVINICGQTNLAELATVLRGAHSVVGNDTGPSHMAAAVGTPTLTLFHGDVNPGWSAPRGKNCRYLIDSKIDNLRLENVYEAWLISAQK
ncbi:MAG: hypothetical protein EB121_00760 [Alphaproteobacteria bacterium]|nr:hypothetical protein [Alphaproteobacteria bacterium]